MGLCPLLGLSLLSSLAQAETSELVFYKYPSQIGTVARRTFKDSQGRPIKELYYRAKSGFLPKKEEDLIPYEIRIHSYHFNGTASWRGCYSPDQVLFQSFESFYGPDGRVLWSQVRDANGVIQRSGNDQTQFFYDNSGKHLIALSGAKPPEIDLSSGWGKEQEGLVCGLGLTQHKGQLKDLSFLLTIWNQSQNPARVVTGLPYEIIELELHDQSGRIILPDAALIVAHKKNLERLNRGNHDQIQTLQPGFTAVYAGPQSLDSWFAQLPPGTYSLIIKRRSQGNDFSLTSNLVKLEIVPGASF